MTSKTHRLICLLLAIGVMTAAGSAATAADPSIGKKIEAFALNDFHGHPHKLADYAKSKLVVVAFVGTECPLANMYMPRLAELAAKWQPKGVTFVGVNANQQDSITEVANHAQRHSLGFTMLKDPGNQVADQFGAARTPQMFVLDEGRTIRYSGRIDDQYGVGYQKPKATRNDLEVAIEELSAGKAVSQPTTELAGCVIGRVKRAAPTGDVTYTNQIARLLQNKCVECHHEGQIAPFSLTSYNEVVGWAEMIKEVVHERRMPPWFAAKEHDEFKNNPSLTPDELALIDKWVDNGCPEGKASELPPPAKYAAGWGISKPDQVFYMADNPYTIPAEGVVEYQNYVVDPGFTTDHWIKEAEVKCGNPAVVHHVIVFIQEPGGDRFGGAPQMAFAPGMTPRRFEKGMAIKAPAGSKLHFQCHYTPNGVKTQDRSYVGFVYADPKEVTHEVVGGTCGELGFKIPPKDGHYLVEARKMFLKDTVLLGMNPHMHLRGKDFKYELQYADGRREVLLDVPRYDFNWQLWYLLKEPRVIPKGTRMICTAHFDNSENNPANPDPNASVTWGEQTFEEMMFGFYSTVRPIEPSDKKITAK